MASGWDGAGWAGQEIGIPIEESIWFANCVYRFASLALFAFPPVRLHFLDIRISPPVGLDFLAIY